VKTTEHDDLNVNLQERKNFLKSLYYKINLFKMKMTLSEMQIQIKMYVLKISNYLISVSRVYGSTANNQMADSWERNLKIDFPIFKFVKWKLPHLIYTINLKLRKQTKTYTHGTKRSTL